MRVWGILLALCFGITVGGCDVGITGDAKAAIRAKLRDPDAAKFKDVEICDADRNIVRGEVNGKNSFGAYTGYAGFVYFDGKAVMLSEDGAMTGLRRCFGPEIMQEVDQAIAEATGGAPPAADGTSR